MKYYFHPLVSKREWEFPSMGLIYENCRNHGKSYFLTLYGIEEETVKNKVAVNTVKSNRNPVHHSDPGCRIVRFVNPSTIEIFNNNLYEREF